MKQDCTPKTPALAALLAACYSKHCRRSSGLSPSAGQSTPLKSSVFSEDFFSYSARNEMGGARPPENQNQLQCPGSCSDAIFYAIPGVLHARCQRTWGSYYRVALPQAHSPFDSSHLSVLPQTYSPSAFGFRPYSASLPRFRLHALPMRPVQRFPRYTTVPVFSMHAPIAGCSSGSSASPLLRYAVTGFRVPRIPRRIPYPLQFSSRQAWPVFPATCITPPKQLQESPYPVKLSALVVACATPERVR